MVMPFNRFLFVLGALVAPAVWVTHARAESVSGTVLAASGQPVDGAEVIAAAPGKAAWPNLAAEDRDEKRQGVATTLTGKDGKFTLDLPADVGLLSITHPTTGYAEVKPQALANSSEVKLSPWSRIEGTFKLGNKPAPAGTKVTLGVFGWNPQASKVQYGYETTTNAQGRYVFEQVGAGLNKITCKASPTASALEQYVAVESGKTVKFDIGGKGRPVTGKVVLPGGRDFKDLKSTDDNTRFYSNSYIRKNTPWPRPPGYDSNSTPQEREETALAWIHSPEGIEQFTPQYRCNIEFAPDGSFRFEDVPAGKYTLVLNIYSRTGLIGHLEHPVEVPEEPALPTDQSLDLGELKFEGATDAPAAAPADTKGL
jgi:hypothetical protein